MRRRVRYAYSKPMELIFIVGIIIAIIGALTIAAVVWQSDTRASAPSPIETEPAADNPQEAKETAPSLASEVASPPPTSEDVIAASVAAAFATKPITIDDDGPLTIESLTALYAHASDGVAVADNAVQIKVANVLANQIEQLYSDYVRLGEERSRLAEALFANLLFEKIERSAGRLEITTERETLDLREKFDQVSTNYNRVQFRLGSLQYLNTRLHDPRVAQQLEELVLDIRQIASKTQ